MPSTPQLERRAFLFLLAILIAGGVYVLFPFLKTILLSIVLAIVFYPLHEKFLKWTGKRSNLAAFFSILAVLLFLIFPIAALLTLVTSQIAGLLEHIPQTMGQGGLKTVLSNGYAYMQPGVAKLEHVLGVKFDVLPLLLKGVQNFAQILAGYSPAVVSGTASFFLHFFIMLMVLFYLFRDGKVFFQTLMILSPVKDQYEMKLASEIKVTIDGIFYGSFLTGLVQAVLSGLGFYFAGVEGSLVWGTITFFVSFIPVIGTATVFIPLIIMLLVQGHLWHALFLGIYGAVVTGSADNILKPVLIKSNMHPLVLFLGLFGGMAVFGAMGLLLGPILMAMLTATVRIYSKDFRESSASLAKK